MMVRSPTSRPSRRVAFALAAALAAMTAGCAGTPPVPTPAPVQAMVDSAPRPPAAPTGLPEGFAVAFAEADARARAIAFWQQCVPTVARLRADGAFGPSQRAPRRIHCARTDDGVPLGGVYEADTVARRVTRLQLVRLDGARPRWTAPTDTGRIWQEARLVDDVVAAITRPWVARNRPFSVVPVVLGDSMLEAWAIPRATKARSFVTGGDVGYARAANRSVAKVADRFATWTQLTLPPGGALRIYSSTRDVPAVADLATARYHAALGRSVTVSTPLAISTLAPGLDPATGARLVWTHAAVPRP